MWTASTMTSALLEGPIRPGWKVILQQSVVGKPRYSLSCCCLFPLADEMQAMDLAVVQMYVSKPCSGCGSP